MARFMRGGLILSGLMLLAGLTPSAQAQTREAFDCSTRFFFADGETVFGFEAAACARQTISRQLLINSIDVIPRVVANSLAIGPGHMEPAGLGDLTPEEFGQRLNSGGAIVITPTADVSAAVAPASKWNAWADGKYTYNDNSPAALDLDGPLWNGMVGLDYKLNDKITFGLMGSFESSNLDGDSADLESTGWGAGPYLGIVLTPNIVFSANLIGSKVSSSQFGSVVDYSSDRIQASSSLTGYWYINTFRFTPGVSISWSKEWIDETSGFALPDQTVETGMLTPSLQIGNTFTLSDAATMEPWLGAALDYTFTNTTKTEGAGTLKDPYTDLRLQAGFNFGFGSNAQLAITGEVGGLMSNDLDTYSVEANFAYQF